MMPEPCQVRGNIWVILWQASAGIADALDFWLHVWPVSAMTDQQNTYPADQDALDREYSPSRLVDNMQRYLDDYSACSIHLPGDVTARAQLGLAYGPHERHTLDYFPYRPRSFSEYVGERAPLVVFIHGGFWAALDGSRFRFPATELNSETINYASLTYRLVPGVSVTEIVADVRRAVRWLVDNAGELGFDPERIVLVGHSAGAHLAAMTMTDKDAPKFAGAIFLSGVFDLEPVRRSYVNDNAKMDAAEAKANSPALLAPEVACPVHIYVGDNETSEFKRQSRLLFDAWRQKVPACTFSVLGNRNHFNIVFDLTLPSARLFKRVTALARAEGNAVALATMKAFDKADPLARHRAKFQLPDGVIYLDGNSLGALPKAAPARVADIVEKEWGDGLIRSWDDAGWYNKPVELGDRIGGLIGAAPGQTIVADSISVNLFKLVCAALKMQPGRTRLITDADNFPSDIYVLQGIERLLPGVEVKLIGRDGSLDQLLDDSVAAVLLTGVDFKTGALHDMKQVTGQVQASGALMIWDLAHSAGALPVDLDSVGADMAVGCTYKYLNAGPGAPAFLYVAERLHAAARNPISGWFGHKDPFAFEGDYVPADDIRQFLVGTPPIVAYGGLEASLDIWEDVSMADLRTKSMAMGDLFIELMEALDPSYGFTLVSARDASKRGSQVSFRHSNGLAVMRALIEKGVIGDFRAPDILRFGFTPLMLGYEDIWQAVTILDDIMKSGSWRELSGDRGAAVT